MHIDVMIVGKGIAGTLLSYELLRSGKSVLVMDQSASVPSASRAASAVLNPLTGKNWTPAKEVSTFIPCALQTYREIGAILGIEPVVSSELFVFPGQEKSAIAFRQQLEEGNSYAKAMTPAEQQQLAASFHFLHEPGKIAPVYIINTPALLDGWQAYLEQHISFSREVFDSRQLEVVPGMVRYKQITANKIVFCEGAAGRDNPFFTGQPFTTNRGDVLLLSIPALPGHNLYHGPVRLVPRADGLFWCGSNYTWQYDSLAPDERWRETTEAQLRQWLRQPFTVVEHLVAERPTTAGQVPLLLQHETMNNLYFFNGLGTRGFSAGPFLAKKMRAYIDQ